MYSIIWALLLVIDVAVKPVDTYSQFGIAGFVGKTGSRHAAPGRAKRWTNHVPSHLGVFWGRFSAKDLTRDLHNEYLKRGAYAVLAA